MIDWLLGKNPLPRPLIGRFRAALRGGAAPGERLLLALERKRVVDAVWLLTLGCQLGLLALVWTLGASDRSAAALSRSALVLGGGFVLASDLGYRLRAPRAVGACVYASQLAGLTLLAWFWSLSGGADNPAGLALFAPPLVASGLLQLRGLALLSAATALAGIWTVVHQQTGALPWQLETLAAGGAAGRAVGLYVFSGVAAALALTSTALARLLMRFYQRLRSHSDLSAEARGMFESVLGGASDPTVVVYADTCQVVYASDSFLRRTMLEPKDVAGRSLYNVLEFEERGRLETLLEQRAGEVPFQRLRLGPESFVANLRFFHTQHDATRYISIAFQEVTDLYWFRSAFDAMDDALLITGTSGELLYANRTANEMFGALYVGKPMLEMLRQHRLVSRAGLAQARSIERVVIQGFPYHLTVSAPRLGPDNQACHVFWLNGFAEQEALADLATRDALTGLHNRRWFERQLQRWVREATPGVPFAIALWNLDGFKELEDELGAAAGDAALQAFVRIVGQELRPDDCLCRLDGDAFALVLHGQDLRGAESAVQRLIGALGMRPIDAGGRERTLSASVGITLCQPGESVAALIARADQALYEAKEGGGGWYGLREPSAR